MASIDSERRLTRDLVVESVGIPPRGLQQASEQRGWASWPALELRVILQSTQGRK